MENNLWEKTEKSHLKEYILDNILCEKIVFDMRECLDNCYKKKFYMYITKKHME